MTMEWIDAQDFIGINGPDGGVVIFESVLKNTGKIILECKKDQISDIIIFAVTTVIFRKLFTTSYFHTQADAEEHINTVKLIIKAGNYK